MKISEKKIAPLYVLMAAICWSTCGVLIKLSTWNGLSIAVYRGIITFIIYWIMLGRKRIRINKIKIAIAFCFFMQSVLYMCANKFTTAGSVTALQNTSPIYIIACNSFMTNRKPPRRDILACILLIIGIFMTVMGGNKGANILGDVLALASGVFYAGVFFFSSISGEDTLESFLIGNALYFLLLPFFLRDPAVQQSTLFDWLFPTTCSLVCGTIAWLCFRKGIRNCKPLQANFLSMIEPILSPVWTFLILGEQMSSISIKGCILVIVTLILYNLLSYRGSLIPTFWYRLRRKLFRAVNRQNVQ